MNRVEVELLTAQTNNAVLKLPERQFPGVLIQGDSLKEIWRLAQDVLEGARQTGNETLEDDAKELEELLREKVEAYESAMASHNLELPYPR